MKALYKTYVGEVIDVKGIFLFYTLDKRAEGYLWEAWCENSLDLPEGAYCFWLRRDEFTVLDHFGRRQL